MSREEFRKAYPKRMALSAGDDSEFVKEFSESSVAGESKTRQADLDSSDINKIVKRFERDGVMPLTGREGIYMDVSEIGDYRSALEQVRKAEEYFETLPAESRAMFSNDPAEFLDKVNDPSQLELLVKAGVVPAGEVRVPEPPVAGGSKEPTGGA